MKGYITVEKWDQVLDPATNTPTGEWHAVGDVTVRAADIAEVYTLASLGLSQIAVTGGGFHKQIVTQDNHATVLAKIEKALWFDA